MNLIEFESFYIKKWFGSVDSHSQREKIVEDIVTKVKREAQGGSNTSLKS